MATLDLIDLKKSYGSVEVLHDINLSIADGEFVVLVGPSGCGKSTTLRMIAGLEDVTSGQIRIGDKVVNNLAPKERDIAMVFQNYAIYPHMSVHRNIGFGLRTSGLPRAERDARIRQVAEALEMTELLERRPNQLSGGQRQRVAIGRAMVRDPAVFLFDEPLSNLDAKLRTQMRLEIKKLHRRVGKTIVFVTHDQVEAMTLADRIVIMKDGYIQQAGTPVEVFFTPANTFVAGFIGAPAMNILPGKAASGAVTLEGGHSVPIGLGQEGQSVLLGVRPDDLSLTDGLPVVEGVVTLHEPLGNEVLAYLDTPLGEVTARFAGRNAPQTDTKMLLHAKPEHMHLFDANSGQRL
ncbi:ABC transporter ATP-binding protein [Halovulum sp. GXIMD14793]